MDEHNSPTAPPKQKDRPKMTMALPADSINLAGFNLQDLLKLKSRIEERLPCLNDLDLQQELVLQFASAKSMLADAQDDKKTPLNQKSQIINTASSLLKQLAEMQIKLYSAERNKALELCLIDILKEADPEDRDAFMEEYERRLSALEG